MSSRHEHATRVLSCGLHSGESLNKQEPQPDQVYMYVFKVLKTKTELLQCKCDNLT